MGKKSRRNRSGGGGGSQATAAGATPSSPSSTANLPPPPAVAAATTTMASIQQLQQYASDGPSDIELLKTTSSSLQAKLDQLTQLGIANDRRGFVSQFVPLDLSVEDTELYYQDLTTGPEAETTWTNLISEIAAIRCGKNVTNIEGDQITKATFYFTHPIFEQCDREVTFVCTSTTSCCVNGGSNSNEHDEWRAEG